MLVLTVDKALPPLPRVPPEDVGKAGIQLYLVLVYTDGQRDRQHLPRQDNVKIEDFAADQDQSIHLNRKLSSKS